MIDGGAADKLIAEVAMNGGKANDLVVLPNGSVVAVDKQAGATATVPYVLDGTTGTVSTSDKVTSKPGKDRQGNDVPASVQQLKANSILKFKVGLKDTDASAAPVTVTPTSLQFAGYPTVTGVKAEESKPTDPKSEDKKAEDKKSDAKSENTAEAKDQTSKDQTSKDQTSKDQASQSDSKSDSKPAPDAVKADKSGSAVKNGGSSAGGSDTLGGGSSVAKSDAGSSKGALASTGASGVAGLLAVGSVALLGGAAILVRRRKA